MNFILRHVVFTCALMGMTGSVFAADVTDAYKQNKVTPLLSSPKTIIGETITYPGGTAAEIVAAIVSIAPGQKTGWHKHGVPLFAYILSGELQVDYGDKGVKTYSEGMAFMEAMDHLHEGRNTTAQPARILAVYMGAEGFRNVIVPQ